jgi:hypothetical protein
MVFLSQMKQGKDGKTYLAKYAAEKDLKKWPGPAYSLFLETITPSDFLTKAIVTKPGMENALAMQVRLYLGYYYSLKGEKEKALEMLRWYLESSGKGTWGHLAALGELKRVTSVQK